MGMCWVNTSIDTEKHPPSEHEREIAALLMAKHQGRENPLPISEICERLNINQRQAKAIIEALIIDFGMKIGASRGTPYGYFVIVDKQDQEAATRGYRRQILAMWRRLRMLENPHAMAELHGQLSMEAHDGTL